jgi:hypothetical protein
LAFPINSIETARLLLRMPELTDAEALMGVLWDPEVVEQKQVTLHEPPGGLDLALKNTNAMVRQWERRGYGQWSVVKKLTGHLIGCVGFTTRPENGPVWISAGSFTAPDGDTDLRPRRPPPRWDGRGNTPGSTGSSASSHPMIFARSGLLRRSVNVSNEPTWTPCTANPLTSTRSIARALEPPGSGLTYPRGRADH